MALNSSGLPLATITGMLIIILFCIFTLASAARYPGPFSPANNWLSDLGTPLKNPDGNVYFNVGCILTGMCMVVMAAGLGIWNVEGGRKKLLMTLGRLSLVVSALGLILVGIFTEGTSLHGIMSLIFFLMLVVFLALVSAALWGRRDYSQWSGYYAILVIALNVLFIYTFFAYEHVPIWEWIAVFSALLWVAVLAYSTLKLENTAKTP